MMYLRVNPWPFFKKVHPCWSSLFFVEAVNEKTHIQYITDSNQELYFIIFMMAIHYAIPSFYSLDYTNYLSEPCTHISKYVFWLLKITTEWKSILGDMKTVLIIPSSLCFLQDVKASEEPTQFWEMVLWWKGRHCSVVDEDYSRWHGPYP